MLALAVQNQGVSNRGHNLGLMIAMHKLLLRLKWHACALVVMFVCWAIWYSEMAEVRHTSGIANITQTYAAINLGTMGEEKHQSYIKIDIRNITKIPRTNRYESYIISTGAEPLYDTVLAVQAKSTHVSHTNCTGCLVTKSKLMYDSFSTYMQEAWSLIYNDAISKGVQYVVKIDDDTIVSEAWLAVVVDDMARRGVLYAGDAGYWADRPVIMFGKLYIIEINTLQDALNCLISTGGPESEDQKTGWCLSSLEPYEKATYLAEGNRIGHKDFRRGWMVICIRCDVPNSHAINSYIKAYPKLNSGEATNGASNQGGGWA